MLRVVRNFSLVLVIAAMQVLAEPGLPEAMAKMQAGDFAGALPILKSVTQREPGNGRAWRNLGLAYQQLKRYEDARDAYLSALKADPKSPVADYKLAGVYARLGDNAHAFEYLATAKALKMDMTNASNDPDLASLTSDARFATLLPHEEDYKNPFVEPVTILREWDGEAAGDQFGWIARNIGDVDEDGIPDVVTSAPTKDIGGASAGRVYVYSTKSGKLLWKADGKPGDQLGNGIESAGDTNGDGVPDVIAGAPGSSTAVLYSGRDGKVLRTFAGETKTDAFGTHVSTAGDVNGDGFADVIIGAPDNSNSTGRAYVYSGKDGKLLLTLSGTAPGEKFGSTVAGYSDRKRNWFLVGAPGAGPRKTGRTYVYEGLSAKPKFTIEADETGRALGEMFISVIGDVDGDGVPDIYASDWSNAAKGPMTGRIYVHSGKDGHRLMTLTGETAGEGFGIGAATAGDVDHDGHADLIVGSWQYAGAAVSGGRAYLYSGRDGSLLKTYTGQVPGETFGFDAVGVGDINGDGIADLLITSAWSGIHGYHSGRMFIISSGVPAKPRH